MSFNRDWRKVNSKNNQNQIVGSVVSTLTKIVAEVSLRYSDLIKQEINKTRN